MRAHIEKIAYGMEGMITGLITHYVWKDVVLSILLSALCAVVTLLIQHYGKRLLNSFDGKKLPKWKQNRKG